MKKEKKQIVLNGSLLRPLSVGRGALLHAGGNIYHTSRVVAILEESEDSNNVLKRTVSTPKLYFYDSGIVCYLTRWSSPETAMEGAMSGALLENYTVAEIIKTYQNAGQEPFLYYYRDKDAREIDLILERDGKLFPIEIKKMASPPKKLTKVFDLIDKSPLQRGTGAILCMADQLGAFDQNNLIVPISLI